jgi:hypothetical protein
MDVTPRLDITAATRYVRRTDRFHALRRASSPSTAVGSGTGVGDGAVGRSVSCGTKHVTVPSPRHRGVVLVLAVSGENASVRPASGRGALLRAAPASGELFLGAKLVTAAPERQAAMARGGVLAL